MGDSDAGYVIGIMLGSQIVASAIPFAVYAARLRRDLRNRRLHCDRKLEVIDHRNFGAQTLATFQVGHGDGGYTRSNHC
jgi:hypothetical protein